MPSKNEWQPIETAPKDGMPILAVIAGFVPCVAIWVCFEGESRWSLDPEEFTNDDHFSEHWRATRYEPTHWMPLPEPPDA